ncbi:MAG TPA: Nif3-like dinuclear metal center hexameric protein [Baekduia sp.]|uniref:Nif3-like dinuclear metal center hexameric protein n=1 Tax=Baekduia sp. TaxID=2600305 RepID=UPI002D767A07|nr:Nif3-like dinuclear metal center hexameric protein [Baekduia sp.]HET6510041.1 Nif3-like dinuclear metal center hexameric protein [Baekduia sp.]
MPELTQLVDHLDRLLAIDDFRDYGPNGLQVPGPTEVQTVVTGVSANGPLIDRAVELGAQLVVVHHGLYWRGDPQRITPLLHRRLAPLIKHDVALAAYHLPLDAHPEHGNNALLAQALGGGDPRPFAEYGFAVTFPEPDGLTVDELTARVTAAVGGREPLVVPAGPERIRTLGIVSGAATDAIGDAIDLGLDAFLTGEPAERGFSIATDAGIHFLAAGHHATETFGVRRLGELLAAEFGVDHRFVDVENPI